MKVATRLAMMAAVALAAWSCVSDQLDTPLDFGYMAPGIYCPDNPRFDLTHLRLVGFGTADVAVLRPASHSGPGRALERWTTSIIPGDFHVVVVPDDGASEVHVAARAVCGPASSQSADAQGQVVQVSVHGGVLTVAAVNDVP